MQVGSWGRREKGNRGDPQSWQNPAATPAIWAPVIDANNELALGKKTRNVDLVPPRQVQGASVEM